MSRRTRRGAPHRAFSYRSDLRRRYVTLRGENDLRTPDGFRREYVKHLLGRSCCGLSAVDFERVVASIKARQEAKGVTPCS